MIAARLQATVYRYAGETMITSVIDRLRYRILMLVVLAFGCGPNGYADERKSGAAPPAPYGALPSDRQLLWHEKEMYAFIHFTTNTFTDKEWGYGDESPEVFNPTDFDADQIVGTLAQAGFTGVILTCKHHDGFCLWPTETTEHNIAASPFKNGQGDIVREISDACSRYGVAFAPYVSPWDRNNEHYGKPEYVTDVFRPQIQELVTQYGEVFEVWFDGANGGDGYYGGARETRSIDRTTYYDWETTWRTIRGLAPNAVIFSDVGPDVRWIGNEHGHAGDPCWATYTPRGRDGSERYGPGMSDYHNAPTGTRNGRFWLPGECDVSIRPGWFYHESQNDRVRTPANLMDLYMHSVGRGASFLLNVPPDRTGQLHDTDVESLRKFGVHLRETFDENLAADAVLIASHVRGDDEELFGPQRLVDGDKWSPWTTDDPVTTPEVVIELPEVRTFNMIRLREDIRLGQRVEGVAVDAWSDGEWREVASAESIGSCRLWRVAAVATNRVRLRVTNSPVCPALSDFGLFLEPEFVQVSRSGVARLPRKGWQLRSTYSGGGGLSSLTDGDPDTLWHTHGEGGESGLPQSFTIDLGRATPFSGFSALPRQDGTPNGMVDRYRIEVSMDGERWDRVAEGEFSNVRNNPIEQEVVFDDKVKARYVRFTALRAVAREHAALAEFNLLP